MLLDTSPSSQGISEIVLFYWSQSGLVTLITYADGHLLHSTLQNVAAMNCLCLFRAIKTRATQ